MTKKKKQPKLNFRFRQHSVSVLLDKILIFRFIRSLHGRFWGIAAIVILLTGLSICFLIRPDLMLWSTAFSDFGKDVRTAPYFAGTMFFAAYALWRWRNYLARTLKRSRPLVGLLTLIIIGFYLVALMPVSWKPWPYRIHLFGVLLAGFGMAAAVVADTLLSKTRRGSRALGWRIIRFLAFFLIVAGGFITFGAAEIINWNQIALLGELTMLIGFSLWVIQKTYHGEVSRSYLSKQLRKFVLVD